MSRTDCVLIGGGVIGLTLARQLRAEGRSVCLLERGACGREASWAGAGILSPCHPQRNDTLFHFQERSLALFPDLCRELLEETGIDPEYERCGELELLFTEQAVSFARGEERGAAGRYFVGNLPRVEVLSPEQLHTVAPAVTPQLLGARLCRHTAQVRNPRFLSALRRSCEMRGVNIREHTLVRDVLIEAGRVTGVVTDRGAVRAGVVIVCAGAWSGVLGALLPRALPVVPVRGQMILLQLAERSFGPIVSRGKIYLVPRRDGQVLVGSTEEPEAGFVKRNTPHAVAHLLEQAVRFVPALSDACVAAMWSGLRPGTPDDKPLIGRVPGVEGLYAATGHFRSGLTNAAATAEALSAMIAGRGYAFDLGVLAPDRAFGGV